MTMLRFRALDAWRCLDLRGGMVGPGYHDFLMDEIEVGPYAAMAFDDPEQSWWVLDDLARRMGESSPL